MGKHIGHAVINHHLEKAAQSLVQVRNQFTGFQLHITTHNLFYFLINCMQTREDLKDSLNML